MKTFKELIKETLTSNDIKYGATKNNYDAHISHYDNQYKVHHWVGDKLHTTNHDNEGEARKYIKSIGKRANFIDEDE